jgi:2-hydroxycyclohexanecarboxyl-CoA dehydrogenase
MTTIQRTAVITGATSDRGIGMATARRYAREGWAVVVLDLDGEKSAKVAREIGNELNVPSFGYAIDVTSEDSVAAAQAAVDAEVIAGNLPAVGALANIAGITSPVPFLETSLELWNKVMAVNATGTYLVTKAFLPAMLENKWGRIVNMSSVSAQRGGGVFGKVPYSSAKAAILGFTKAWPASSATAASPSTPSPPEPLTPTSASAPPPNWKPQSPATSRWAAPAAPRKSPPSSRSSPAKMPPT